MRLIDRESDLQVHEERWLFALQRQAPELAGAEGLARIMVSTPGEPPCFAAASPPEPEVVTFQLEPAGSFRTKRGRHGDEMTDPFRKHVLQDKVAVITGGGSGINLAIAERFAEQGARVALIGRSQEKLDAAAAKITSEGGTAIALAADVRDYAALADRLQSVPDRLGAIDILICGAAGNFPAPATGMSSNGFKAVVNIDLLGTFNTCRAAFEHLRKPGAAVVNISAVQAFVPMHFQSHVCAAKAGVDMLTRTLALEWGPAGIRVNSIAPGAVEDTEGMRRLAPTAQAHAALAGAIPLRRFARKDEIADLALFLCSDAAQFVTGAVVVCDGGQSLVSGGSLLFERHLSP